MTFNGRNKLGREHLRLVRAWFVGSTTWWFFLAVLMVALTLDLSTMLRWRRGISQEVTLRNQVHSTQVALRQPARAAQAASEPAKADLAYTLPEAVDTQDALETLHRTAAEAGAVLAAVQVQSRAPTRELLARSDLTVLVRGSYPKLKQLVGEVLDRYPNATLTHLALRRNGPPEQVEATMAFGVWGAPTSAETASVPGAQ